ncbi:MAG: hypothetical protein K8T20_10515 [Planctomycetes bacterium]|nr:hypothetical protein [Planctomycetota bacterium]
MSKESWAACAISTVSAIGLVVIAVNLSRVREDLTVLEGQVKTAEPGGAGTRTGPQHSDADRAEIDRLKKELALVRQELAALPADMAGGTSISKKELRDEVEAVLEAKRVQQLEEGARRQGKAMAAAEKKRIEMLAAQLKLDEAQQLRVKDVLDRQVEQYVKFWSAPPSGKVGSSGNGNAYFDEIRRINDEADQEVKKLLSPEQADLYGKLPQTWFDGMSAGPGPK